MVVSKNECKLNSQDTKKYFTEKKTKS